VLLSPLSIILQGQPDVLAALVSSTTTQTVTGYTTLTGAGQSTEYETFKQVSSVQTVTATTYSTKGVITVQVPILTTVRILTKITVIYPSLATLTGYTSKTGYVMGYAKSTVYGTMTSQYMTSVPTTVFSTSASTSTFATSQVLAVTATQTLTSVSEQSFSEVLSQNLWIILVIGAAVLVVLAFTLGRRRRQAGTLNCMICGTQNPATNQFCVKCGSKLRTPTV
jgi:hypothetical protein